MCSLEIRNNNNNNNNNNRSAAYFAVDNAAGVVTEGAAGRFSFLADLRSAGCEVRHNPRDISLSLARACFLYLLILLRAGRQPVSVFAPRARGHPRPPA